LYFLGLFLILSLILILKEDLEKGFGIADLHEIEGAFDWVKIWKRSQGKVIPYLVKSNGKIIVLKK
jgi:hypothetical protein